MLAGACFDSETILTADLDLDEMVRGKYDLDVTGHYARPDVFSLQVNERPQPAVVTSREELEDPNLGGSEQPPVA